MTDALAGAGEFDELYQARYLDVVATVHALTGDLADAQDLAQEAFCRAWQRWSRLRRYEDPAAWVRRVAMNHRGAPAPGGTAQPAVPDLSLPPLPAASDGAAINDPITHVDPTNMTVTVAANPAAPCPSGRLVSNGAATKDGLVLNVVTIPTAAYGALNGDGRPEAVIAAGCFRSDTGDATETEQLLVVSRATDGTLAGTWAGAVGPAVVRVRAR